MTDRETADVLARKVMNHPDWGWMVGMLPLDSQGNPVNRICDDEQRYAFNASRVAIPDLLDPATAALLAVEVLSKGKEFDLEASPWRFINWSDFGRSPTHKHLGIAAGRAWLAITEVTDD